MKPIRSLMIGDCDHYRSPYMLGVADAARRLEIEHRQVSIRRPLRDLARAVDEARPDILWTHMLLWAPKGSPDVGALVGLMRTATKRGARVILHDGDYKERTRYPHHIGDWCALALANHTFDRSAWGCPTLRWPYFAAAQDRIADPVDRWRCELFFAGRMDAGPVYAKRTALLGGLQRRGVRLRTPTAVEGNTLEQTAEVAASADAVLGFGRPDVPGWLDVRVFQYSGAGAILLHDDVGGYLEPWQHFVPYESESPESVVEALARLRAMTADERMALRRSAFAYVQKNHSSVARVLQVLDALELT